MVSLTARIKRYHAQAVGLHCLATCMVCMYARVEMGSAAEQAHTGCRPGRDGALLLLRACSWKCLGSFFGTHTPEMHRAAGTHSGVVRGACQTVCCLAKCLGAVAGATWLAGLLLLMQRSRPTMLWWSQWTQQHRGSDRGYAGRHC